MVIKKVIIVGGYGAVGKIVSEHLSKNPQVNAIVAGRNGEKAKELATTLNCNWREIDIYDEDSIEDLVFDIDIIINCFVDSTSPNSNLAEAAIKKGIYYMDLAGVPIEYSRLFVTYYKRAKKNNATLITCLGINPGIPGIILYDNKNYFDKIHETNTYFTLGSKLNNLSVLSLQGVGLMLNTAPHSWYDNNWGKPRKKTRKKKIIKPYNKDIYFNSAMITEDLMSIPWKTNIDKMNFWSGMESTFQGMILYLGIKFNLTKTIGRTKKFLNILKKLGKNGHNDINLIIESEGVKDGKSIKRKTELFCQEEYATALAPIIACEQILEGKIKLSGAFFPHEVIPTSDFIQKLKKISANFSDEITEI